MSIPNAPLRFLPLPTCFFFALKCTSVIFRGRDPWQLCCFNLAVTMFNVCNCVVLIWQLLCLFFGVVILGNYVCSNLAVTMFSVCNCVV